MKRNETLHRSLVGPTGLVRRAMLLLAACFALLTGLVHAQTYPAKPIKFVVPYTPGGSNDILARIVAERLTERLGQPVVVENKAGADSIIGTDFVAKSPPDGYTFLIGSLAMAMNPGLYERLPYDPAKDFTPITLFASDPLVLAINPAVPAATLKEFIALAKTKPGQLFYSSGAPAFQVTMEWFKKLAGVDIVHVPYKGSGPAIAAAVGGEVPMVVVSIAPAAAQLRAGKLRALAVTAQKRDPVLPDIPTVMEASGLDCEGGIWVGLFAPAGTPRPIIDKIHGELAAVLKSESVKGRFTQLGYDTTGMAMPPAEFASFYRANVAKWTKVIKDVGIRAEASAK